MSYNYISSANPSFVWVLYHIFTLDMASPGSTIQLASGDYYIHKPLVKETFSGSIIGAGKGVTNIIASKASNGDLFAAEQIDAWDD